MKLFVNENDTVSGSLYIGSKDDKIICFDPFPQQAARIRHRHRLISKFAFMTSSAKSQLLATYPVRLPDRWVAERPRNQLLLSSVTISW